MLYLSLYFSLPRITTRFSERIMNQLPLYILIFCFSIFSFVFAPPAYAKEFLSPEELEKWFNSDDELPTTKINEGLLTFLTSKVKKGTFHSTINVTINQDSIDNGWVKLTQCYSNLDPIQRTAIVYRNKFIKDLTVTSKKNIKSTKVSGNKIFLESVQKKATLCVSLNSRTFYQNEDMSFSLVNGPYHRKFLDGYYPYHLNLNIHYDSKLKFKYSLPQAQPGFAVTQQSNSLLIDTLFEGRLKTEFRFQLK